MQHPDLQSQFDQWNLCIIVPTYNNDGTLEDLLAELKQVTRNVIVINDGSTDKTPVILKQFESDFLIHHQAKNQGKGVALKTGFDLAFKKGYKRAITIDSDGQHRVSDLPVFIENLKMNPDAMLVGSRNMEQENVPGTSSFGHKFSNFWYQIMTGNKLPDTQSGYRLYPLEPMQGKKIFTTKYELEMELVVRMNWWGVDVIPIPIDVYYPPDDERVTHFRKVPDFSRIFILNTVMVLIALLYIHPIRFFKNLKKKSAKEFLREYILENTESNSKISLAIMMGLFIGVSPFWGAQIFLIIFFSVLFKLNKVIALVAGHISIPPMIPLILFASYKMGGLVITPNEGLKDLNWGDKLEIADVWDNFLQYIVGSFMLGTFLAVSVGLISYLLLTLFKKDKSKIGLENP
ncbi:MAG: DUF2062 domain-containing protein [Saprospiraceae bacterium]